MWVKQWRLMLVRIELKRLLKNYPHSNRKCNVMVPPREITKKVKDVVAKYVDTSAINLNKLIDGSSVNRSNASNTISIQDLVKRLNGSGLKVTYFFLLLLKMMADILKFTETSIIDECIEEHEYRRIRSYYWHQS